MPTIRIPGPGNQSIMLSFAQIPAEAKTMFRRGFSVLARLTKDKQEAVVRHGIESIEEVALMGDNAELGKAVGLDKQDVDAAVGAVMLLASAIGIQSAGKVVEDAPSELAKAELLDSIDLPKLEPLIASMKKSGIDIGNRMERSQIASRVIPAYRSLSSVTELRVTSGEKRFGVAVALLRISTDEDDRHLEFQVTALQVKRILKRLQDLLSEMDEVEKLVSVWEKKQG